MYTIIDIDTWKRKELFQFFSTFDNPTWDLIAELRITDFYTACKTKQQSFFLSFLHAASSVANSIEEMRCRIDPDGHVRQYQVVHPGSTVLYENGTYGYSYLDFHPDYTTFMNEAAPSFENQKQMLNRDPKDDDLARIYFSPIPWVSFSGFRHPFRAKGNTSIPMIVFGKHFERDQERYITVGLTLHHGLADGYHAGLFFKGLQSHFDQTGK